MTNSLDSRFELRLWLAQRVSGALLALLVVIHLATMIVAVRGGLSAAEILGRFAASALWPAFYAAFVLCVAVHAPIGIRNIVREHSAATPNMVNGIAALTALLLLGLGGYAVVALSLASATA